MCVKLTEDYESRLQTVSCVYNVRFAANPTKTSQSSYTRLNMMVENVGCLIGHSQLAHMRITYHFITNLHITHSRPQRPRSFWSVPRIASSGRVQQRKSAIHGLPFTLRMFRVKFDKPDWFWSQSIVFTNTFKTGMSLELARGHDSWC